MEGFPAGLAAGGALVLLVAVSFVGTPDVLEEVLGALDAPLVGLDQVLVGHFVLFKGDRAWIGSTVYAPGIPAAILLDRHLDAYQAPLQDMTPEPARAALCAQPQARCSNATGGDRLLLDLGNVTRALRDDLDATLLEDVKLSVRSHEEGVLHLAVVEVAPRTLNATPGADASVDQVRRHLTAACREVGDLPVNATPSAIPRPSVEDGCEQLYVLNSAWALWDPSRSVRLEDPAPGRETGVLGPLSWRSVQVLPEGGVEAALRTPAYLPTAALLWVLGAVVVAVLLHYALEGAIGNAALPLPPVAVLVGVVLLFVVDAHRDWNVHALMTRTYGVVLAAYLVAYFYLDLAGVHFLTLLSTVALAVVGFAAVAGRLKDVLLDQPMGLLTTLYGGGVTTDAANLAAKALFTVGVACVAILLLSGVVAWRAYRSSRAVLPEARLRRLLDEDSDALWQELARLRASAEAGALSWAAYASVTARAYRHAKRLVPGWWWKDPMPFVKLAPLPEAKGKALRHRPEARALEELGEDLDPVDELWRRHVEAARTARSFRHIRMG